MKRRIHKVTRVYVPKAALDSTHVETVCGRVFETPGEWQSFGTRFWYRVTCLACKRTART